LGVGDQVLIGGYPLGKEMFLALTTNRGIVQPTFYDGIVSAIIPPTKNTETRLLQISTIAIGGISGGVVCDPTSGAVLGMVTSGLISSGQSLPITYAIPSEVLQPWADAISFEVKGGKVWR
jgi:S1-C subfamily serine protease